AGLTRQLLTFSRKQVMQSRALDMNEVVSNASKMLRRLLGEGISLQCEFSPGAAPIQADVGMMEQIVVNLAVNARDAMPSGGQLFIRTRIAEFDEAKAALNSDARPGRFVCLEVIDTGTGIPENVLPRIFEPFFTTKEVGKGTGLGLATVYGIARQHHGWVEVASQIGHGTTFRVYLPLNASVTDGRLREAPQPVVRGGTETILVVEDEPGLRDLARNILSRYGYRVLTAAHGKEALQLWAETRQPIHLLLTDMVMPEGISGWDLAQQLRAQSPALKVIYSSGYSMELLGHRQELQEGINFLAKPYEPAALAKAVRTCLDI
ncbi:MAG: ATP-binding protein, partial [Verrucomicrobiota bacterium]